MTQCQSLYPTSQCTRAATVTNYLLTWKGKIYEQHHCELHAKKLSDTVVFPTYEEAAAEACTRKLK